MKGEKLHSVEITPRSKMSGDGMNERTNEMGDEGDVGETFVLYP